MTETTEVTLDDSEGSKDLSDRAGEAPEGMDEQAFGDSVDDLEALPGSARRALAALLTNRFITRTGNRAAWEALLDHEPRIRSRLADLFLDLVVDRDYDVAFKRQGDKEDVPVMLRRDRPLTREATLLLVHMRQLHAYTDSQDDPVLLPLLCASRDYSGDRGDRLPGSDPALRLAGQSAVGDGRDSVVLGYRVPAFGRRLAPSIADVGFDRARRQHSTVKRRWTRTSSRRSITRQLWLCAATSGASRGTGRRRTIYSRRPICGSCAPRDRKSV